MRLRGIESDLEPLWNRKIPVEIAIFGHTLVDSSWMIGPRQVDEHLIYLVVDGGFAWQQADGPIACGVGDLLWLPPHWLHRFTTLPGRPLRVLHLRFRIGTARLGRETPLLLRHVDHLQALLRTCQQRYRPGATLDAAGRALLYAFLVGVGEQAAQRQGGGLDPAQRQRLEHWLVEHWQHDPGPADIARVLGLSGDYASRRFRTSYGSAPRSWLLAYRIRKVAELLLEDPGPIATLAARAGFTDPPRFSRQFRRTMGTSPGDWRRRHVPAKQNG